MAFRKLTDFIQEDVIVAMIIDDLRALNVTRNIASYKTQSGLGKGSSYKIPGVVDFTVGQADGTDLTYQDAASTGIQILVDKYPFIPFYLEDSDINETNALSLATEFAKRAAEQIASTMDTDVLNVIFVGATATTESELILGKTLVPVALLTADDIADYVEVFAGQLKEANVDMDAVIVVPSFAGVKLSRYWSESLQGASTEEIKRGFITNIYGIDVYSSNNMPTGVAGSLAAGEFAVIGGKRSAFTVIEGLTVVKSGDSETRGAAQWNQFGQVYGRGYSQPAAWYKGVVTK